jgi:A/G-specific adenine glycosylase
MDFAHLIISWYQKNKRDLPWRHTRDPYLIWVSEVILQQTRVEQGLAYYKRFVERFPDVETLAGAGEEEVIKTWQGLGYYTRARNMHHAAMTLCNENKAEFPKTYEEIIKLRGIGDYSASAISSMAFGAPHPVVDGNVLRVVARYEGILEPVNTSAGHRRIKNILLKTIDPQQPGVFNQAVMELGALVCKPKQPLCDLCPIRSDCFARLNQMTAELPRLTRAKPAKVRFFNYLVILSREKENGFIWLRKRTGDDIWKNMYDFPLVEADEDLSLNALENTRPWQNIAGKHEMIINPVIETARHILSHRELRVKFFFVNSDDYDHPEYIKVALEDTHKYPVSRLIEKILKKVAIRPGIFFKFPD